uniref:RNA-directed RNA polymerase n=1 Tax=Parastrongyloides trichosuri TaxID=131310 RepID=A0A0N4ZR34_PARTI
MSSSRVDDLFKEIKNDGYTVDGVKVCLNYFADKLRKDPNRKKLTNSEIKTIIQKFYGVTKENPHLNVIWGKHTNILQYNNKDVRRTIVKDLVEKDVVAGKIAPYNVLNLVFQDRELVKLITLKETFIQAALQVQDLYLGHIDEFKNRMIDGTNLQDLLRKFIGEKAECLIEPLKTLADGVQEKLSDCVESLIDELKLNRSNLNKIDLLEIQQNFYNYIKTVCNINPEVLESVDNENLFILDREIKAKINHENIVEKYKMNTIKKDLALDILFCHLTGLMEDERGKILRYIGRQSKDLYDVLGKLDYEYYIKNNKIPSILNELSRSSEYPSNVIKPKYGDKYFSYKNSSLFKLNNQQELFHSSNSETHGKWPYMKFITTVDEVDKELTEIQSFLKTVKKQMMFLDVKFAVNEGRERPVYLNIHMQLCKREKFLSFDLDKISHSAKISEIVKYFFNLQNMFIVVFHWEKLKEKMSGIFKTIFIIFDQDKSKRAQIVCLTFLVRSLVEGEGKKCSLTQLFPETWEEVFCGKGKNNIYEIDLNDELPNSILRSIRSGVKNGMSFSQLCYLTTQHDFDDSDDLNDGLYSFWQRKPLRKQQEEAMATKILAMYDIMEKFNDGIKRAHGIVYKGPPILERTL